MTALWLDVLGHVRREETSRRLTAARAVEANDDGGDRRKDGGVD